MKTITTLLTCLLATISAMADETSCIRSEKWTYGNIYVKEPNKQIKLEKEYMFVGQESIKAVFSFRNTTNSEVTLFCAFPVVVDLFCEKNDEYPGVVLGRIDGQHDLDIFAWSVAFGHKIYFKETYDGSSHIAIDLDSVMTLDKQLRIYSYSEYDDLLSACYEEEPNPEYHYGCHQNDWIDFKIEQDGRKVEIDKVGIETTVGNNGVAMVIHFSHQLTFAPNSLTKVVVEYDTNIYHRGNSYSTKYDISTGAKWKGGAIGDFILCTSHMELDTEDEQFDITQSNIGYVYSKSDYHPSGYLNFRSTPSYNEYIDEDSEEGNETIPDVEYYITQERLATILRIDITSDMPIFGDVYSFFSHDDSDTATLPSDNNNNEDI